MKPVHAVRNCVRTTRNPADSNSWVGRRPNYQLNHCGCQNAALCSLAPQEERRARVPFPSRVAGHAPRSSQDGASREGIRFQGGRAGGGGGGSTAEIRVALPARDSQGIGRRGFGSARANSLACRRGNRSRSIARGGERPKGAVAPVRAVSGPLSGGVRERSRLAHPQYAAPTRPPVRICGSHTRPTRGIVSCRIRRQSRATSCQEWAMGSVGSSAERRRPLPGPVLLCQPCGGHPLLVRKSSVSYPSVCCVNAWYGARSAA